MRTHSPDELERFFAPFVESSTTWARYRPEPDAAGVLVHRPPGDGERFKSDTKAGRYRCVLPDCDGLLTAHAGAKNAHHWQHRTITSVAHSPETLWHIAAKAVLVEFARARQPVAVIRHDDAFTPSKNKPDVWVQWPGGDGVPAGNVAFEAQHSAISIPGLKLRNARYENDSIVPVWLFSHLAAPVIGVELADGAQLRLHEAHKIAADTAPLRWFNPDERAIATAYVRKSIRPDVRRGELWHDDDLEPITYTRRAERGDNSVNVGIDSLDDCTLDATGLHTPTDRWIEEQVAHAAAEEIEALAARQRRLADRLAPHAPFADSARYGPSESPPPPPDPPPLVPQQRALRYDPLDGPCPYCAGARVARSAWPAWYRPPAGTVQIAVCSLCDLVLGAIVVSSEGG
jgi:hypothetical protein